MPGSSDHLTPSAPAGWVVLDILRLQIVPRSMGKGSPALGYD